MRVIKKVSIISLILLSFFVIKNDRMAEAATVNIPDANLKECINGLLNQNPTDNITETQMSNITILNCRTKGIVSLEGVQYLTDVTDMYLYNNQIEDLTPLKDLTTLSFLELNFNNVSDLKGLENITSLEFLMVANNSVEDLHELTNLTNLFHLEFEKNYLINDIEPLRNLTNLERLYIDNNLINDISPLEGLTKLTRLYIQNNKISDLSPLKNMSNISSLQLDNQTAVLEEQIINESEYSLPDVLDNNGNTITYNQSNTYQVSLGESKNVSNDWNSNVTIGSVTTLFSGTIEKTVAFIPLPTLNANSFEIEKETALSDEDIIKLSKAEAIDGLGVNISSNIVVDRQLLDVNNVGLYTVQLSVTDDYGQAAIFNVEIEVINEVVDNAVLPETGQVDFGIVAAVSLILLVFIKKITSMVP